jgi:hypothetical protein
MIHASPGRGRPVPRADPCHESLAQRALANSACRALGLAALALACACSRDPAAPASAHVASTQADGATDPKARIHELVEALMPIDKTVTSDVKDQHFLRGQSLIASLRKGGREVGVEALRVLGEKKPGDAAWPVDVERGLLDVASHAAPDDARPLLEALVRQYGPSLELRTQALVFYSETWPQDAIAFLEPLITKARPNQTLPPAEFMVDAWVTACTKVGRSPVKELSDIATNMFQDETARIRAVKDLGHYRDPLATQALSAILVESTGDGYLRRMAAQGLRDTLDRESACKIFEEVAQREADMGMLDFLKDMLDKNCSR